MTDVTNTPVDDKTTQTKGQVPGTTQAKVDPPAPANDVPKDEAPKDAPAAEVWEPTGDTFVDTLAKGYIESGGQVERFQALLDDVATNGALTEAAKVELRKAYGPLAEALIPTIEQRAAEAKAFVEREQKAVYDAVGGKAKFTEMQAWAKENLSEDVRGFLNVALNKGGQPAQLAIQQLKELMIKGGATVTGETFKPGAGAQGKAETLTRQAYLSERIKLERTGDKAGIEQLQARARVALEAATKKGVRW